jgi:ribonuclease P protein component
VLDRRHRLTTSAGFTTATRRGRRAGTTTLVLHLGTPAGAGTPSGEDPRVGFVVSKAVGNAVHRNRVKRRLRHIARARLTSLPASAVLVVRALPSSTGATYAALSGDFDAALRRLGLDAGTVNTR